MKITVKRIAVLTFFALCTEGASTNSALALPYTMVDMGPGIGWDVNSSGQAIVTGSGSNTQSFYWSGESRTDFPTSYSFHRGAINEAGVAVGGLVNFHAVTWTNGAMVDLGSLGGAESVSYGINNDGYVVGQYLLTEGTSEDDFRAFLHDGNTLMSLGTLPGGSYAVGNDVNNGGIVTGTSYVGPVGDGDSRGFIYSEEIMLDIGTLGGPTQAWAINDMNQIVGSSTNSSGEIRAFLYENGTMQDLGTGGGSMSQAYDINDNSQVVGTLTFSQEPSSRAFVWDEADGMVLLNDLEFVEPLSGWTNLSTAYGISDQGHIVGSGV